MIHTCKNARGGSVIQFGVEPHQVWFQGWYVRRWCELKLKLNTNNFLGKERNGTAEKVSKL